MRRVSDLRAATEPARHGATKARVRPSRSGPRRRRALRLGGEQLAPSGRRQLQRDVQIRAAARDARLNRFDSLPIYARLVHRQRRTDRQLARLDQPRGSHSRRSPLWSHRPSLCRGKHSDVSASRSSRRSSMRIAASRVGERDRGPRRTEAMRSGRYPGERQEPNDGMPSSERREERSRRPRRLREQPRRPEGRSDFDAEARRSRAPRSKRDGGLGGRSAFAASFLTREHMRLMSGERAGGERTSGAGVGRRHLAPTSSAPPSAIAATAFTWREEETSGAAALRQHRRVPGHLCSHSSAAARTACAPLLLLFASGDVSSELAHAHITSATGPSAPPAATSGSGGTRQPRSTRASYACEEPLHPRNERKKKKTCDAEERALGQIGVRRSGSGSGPDHDLRHGGVLGTRSAARRAARAGAAAGHAEHTTVTPGSPSTPPPSSSALFIPSM